MTCARPVTPRNHHFEMSHQHTTTSPNAQVEPLAFTAREAARLLGLSVGSIRNLIRKGELPVIRVTTKAVRVPADSLRKFIDDRRWIASPPRRA